MDRFKVGLIGTGYIGMVHLEMLRRLPAVEVIAVADNNRDLAKAASEKFTVPKVYFSAEELIKDRDVEIIHNCTPNNIHFNINSQAIKAGKEVLSEKPLALNSKESAELVKLAGEYDTVTGINFCYRYYPVVQEAAARVRKGDLGEVRAIIGHFLQDWLFYETDYSWRLDPEFAGNSNIFADLGSHWCDMVQFVTGRKIVEVMAEFNTCIPRRKKPKSGPLTFSTAEVEEYDEVEITLEDYASLFIRLDNGARGNFTTCQVAAGRKVDIDIQIFGSKESYAWNHVHPNDLWIGHRDRGNETFYESFQLQQDETRKYALLPTGHPMGYHDAVYNFFCDYYDAVTAKRNGEKNKVSPPDFVAGHEEMCIIDAAIKSAKKGRWEKV
ncbi:MAG TPA: Gfo/Idh/MocA family oxidoreductase [bacterium]|nr:Gfo/Idh/MocA family oxidoreductase [bacterium]